MDLRSLEQMRAEFAYKKVLEVSREDKKTQGRYRSYVKKAPLLILTNGLGQALAFYLSKLDNKVKVDYESINPGDFDKGDDRAYAYLYKHIAEWLAEGNREKKEGRTEYNWSLTNGKDPLRYYMEATGTEAMVLTDEAIAFLNWLKRFAEAMLEKDENGE